MSDSRVDRLLGIKEQTPQEVLGCPWGIPIYGRPYNSFKEIRDEVKYDPDTYENPLDNFLEKLRRMARRGAIHTGISEEIMVADAMEKYNNYFYANGKPKFTMTKRETRDSRIMAWDAKWIARKDKTPLATTEFNTEEYIKAMPAVVIMILDGTYDEDRVDGMSHLKETIELLEIPGGIDETGITLIEACPWAIVSGTVGMPDEDSIHTEIAFLVNLLEIAFNFESDRLHWQRAN
jgi:hypothetical protein